MPKTEIDYSNTIIYQIKCKDTTVTDVYVGHTTNFVQRKHAHKQSCNNDKSANYKCKLYEVIRNNGGWSNWQMEIIVFLNCRDHYEARQKEQEYFISLHATLNSIEPMPKPKQKEITNINISVKPQLYCDACNSHFNNIQSLETHQTTNKHKKQTQKNVTAIPVTQNSPKLAEKFICEKCDYKCCKQSDFDKHISTLKHKMSYNELQQLAETRQKNTCKCGKEYIYRQGLYNHRKTCKIIEQQLDETPNENMIIQLNTNDDITNANDMTQLTNLVIEVVKNNSDFQKQMFEMCRNMQSTIISNNCNNNTTNNTTFNLQVFLNEYCKDAMNISEFIDSFDLQISDLENVGRLGYIEGMSNIIISKINDLDVNKRPIHCSDLKREIIYIKEDNVWGREDANNTKFRKVISKVTRKNIGKLSDWRNMYPDYMDIESENNDIYMKLIKEAMGPDDTVDNETKIMKKVIKHLVIDKKALAEVL
jgi:hypothetical protein